MYIGGSSLENEMKRFIKVLSAIDLVFLIIMIAAFFGLISGYFARYQTILMIVAALASAVFVLLGWVSTGLIRVNRPEKLKGWAINALVAGTSLVLPVYIFLAGFFRKNKNGAERIFIHINNVVAKYLLQKKAPGRILMLLPYCMQNKDCTRRVAEDIENCRRCGGCKIGEIAELARMFNISAVVAKGGTAARNSVKEYRPEFIFAVACERELVSGIGDIGGIPVMGVINQRPNGYCTNTTVDVAELKNILQEMTGSGKRLRGAEYEVQVKNPIA